MTTRIALAVVLATLALPSAVARADNPKLVAVVGTSDAFVISLRDASGNVVTHVDPGTYDISVSDRSESHNFHLRGLGVDMSTPIGDMQVTTWTVTFTDSRYTYVCDALAGSVGPKRTMHLSGPGVNKKTGVRTRGRVTWNVTLVPGRYTYRSDKTKKLRGILTVNFPA